MRRLIPLVLVALLLLPAMPIIWQGKAQPTDTYTFQGLKSAHPYNKPYLPIEEPAPASPAVAPPGGSFTLRINGYQATSAYIWTLLFDSQLGKLRLVNLSLQLTDHTASDSLHTYSALIPTTADFGVYDIVVTLDNGDAIVVPRGLWVIDPSKSDINIAHMSDIHFGTADVNYKLTAYLLSQLLGADVMIVTGDYAEGASGTQYTEGRAYRYSFAYGIPEFMNPGNHDYPNTDYKKYEGQTCWYREPLPWLFIFLCNTRDAGYLAPSYLDELESLLASSNSTVKIVTFHHPVFYWQGEVKLAPNSPLLRDPHVDSSSPLSYYWGDPSIIDNVTRRFLSMVLDYNITLILSGHIHRDQYVLYQPPGEDPDRKSVV